MANRLLLERGREGDGIELKRAIANQGDRGDAVGDRGDAVD